MIGKMTLNRNVDNFFAEVEQSVFHPGHIVPGIDFSNDPLLQGRLFSYTDTQLIRLGGPNFHELPINRPVNGFYNHQRDGYNRITINTSNIAYHENSMADNRPGPVPPEKGGYEHYQEKVEGRKVRARSDSFKDHFSQPRMFWNSMSDPEKDHIVSAYAFELGKCDKPIREMNIENVLKNISLDLAQQVAEKLGVTPPTECSNNYDKVSPALSEKNYPYLPDTRKIGVLIDKGFDGAEVKAHLEAFTSNKMKYEIISETQQMLKGSNKVELEVDHTFDTTDSVLYDALYIVGGPDMSVKFKKETKKFIQKTYDHYKAIAASQTGIDFLEKMELIDQPGILKADDDAFTENFTQAIADYRHFDRAVII